jgi:hypothetical protein
MFRIRCTNQLLYEKHKQNRSGDLRTGRIGSETAHEPSHTMREREGNWYQLPICERVLLKNAY